MTAKATRNDTRKYPRARAVHGGSSFAAAFFGPAVAGAVTCDKIPHALDGPTGFAARRSSYVQGTTTPALHAGALTQALSWTLVRSTIGISIPVVCTV